MANVLNIMQDIVEQKNNMELVNASFIPVARESVQKGVQCILKTQIKTNGKLTGWCAQYDEKTLQPAKARAYELPSISGMESVGVARFLMRLPDPSAEIIRAVDGAIDWFNASKITGYDYQVVKDPSMPKGIDRILSVKEGGVLWARFYDIQTNQPFFCGRDGVKKKSLNEIEPERRAGYGWYGDWPLDALKEYTKWKTAHNRS